MIKFNVRKKVLKVNEFIFERKINYYETDRMGIVHHSNYIRFLEEARCALLEKIGIPFSYLEENGLTIPVLGVNVEYKYHVTFDDIIEIHVFTKEFNGVRLTMGYNVKDKKNGNIVLKGETKHCFTDRNLRPINLKKYNLEIYNKFNNLKEEE